MKLFKFNENLISFTYPIVKIVVCLFIIVLCFVIRLSIQYSNKWIEFSSTLLCVIVTVTSILSLYVSICELFQTSWNRKDIKRIHSDINYLTIEEVTKILTVNDIVEIEVRTNNHAIKIGASSECEYSSSVFRDKLFYIESLEYDTIESFATELIKLFPEGSIPVSKIDNLPVI